MGVAAPVAGAMTVASLGLGAASSAMKGQATVTAAEGTQAADTMQAAKLERAAQFGQTQALLTNTTYRENLNTTLDNIEAVRAAAGNDPTSPTTAALMDRSEMLSDRQRMAAVGTIKSQSEEDLASADYLRKAGDFAVAQAKQAAEGDYITGAAKFLGGFASLKMGA